MNIDDDVINRLERIEKTLGSDKSAPEKLSDNYYIVRGDRSGVFAGEIVSRDGKEVVMKNSRRLWYWSGAASLSQLAVDGTSKPTQCKFPAEMPEHLVLDAIEIIKTTAKAQRSLKEVAVWRA